MNPKIQETLKQKCLCQAMGCLETIVHHLDFAAGMNYAEKVYRDTAFSEGYAMGIEDGELIFFQLDSWDKVKADVEDAWRHTILKHNHRQRQKEILEVTADTIIEPKIKETGFPYYFEYQQNRVKVFIRLDFDHMMTFYVRYRDFQTPEIIDSIPEMIAANLRYINMFGTQISLRKNNLGIRWKDPHKA